MRIVLGILLVSFTIISCKKKELPAGDPVNATADPMITGTLSGSAIDFSDVQNISLNEGIAGGTNPSTYVAGFMLINKSNSQQVFALRKGNLIIPDGTTPTDLQLMAHFPRDKELRFDADLDTGIVITHFDASGVEWSTNLGSADQTGSSFIITDVAEINEFGFFWLGIEATFNCKLYNASGDMRTLNDGVVIGRVKNEFD